MEYPRITAPIKLLPTQTGRKELEETEGQNPKQVLTWKGGPALPSLSGGSRHVMATLVMSRPSSLPSSDRAWQQQHRRKRARSKSAPSSQVMNMDFCSEAFKENKQGTDQTSVLAAGSVSLGF